MIVHRLLCLMIALYIIVILFMAENQHKDYKLELEAANEVSMQTSVSQEPEQVRPNTIKQRDTITYPTEIIALTLGLGFAFLTVMYILHKYTNFISESRSIKHKYSVNRLN